MRFLLNNSSGPSRCGKTFFVSDLIENIKLISKNPPEKILYIFKKYQEKYDEMNVDYFIEDSPGSDIEESISKYAQGQSTLVIFDDLISSTSLPKISDMFTVSGRHSSLSLVFLSQRMFVNNDHIRTISTNSDYIVIFKNPQNRMEINNLSRRITPENGALVPIYDYATKDPFSYLMINLTQECNENVKFLSHLFNRDGEVCAYKPT